MIKKLANSIFKILLLCLLGVGQATAQNAGILPNAKTTFVDQNGKPLSSGKVYFYEPGGTTAKTTWQDINKTVANSNPVNLDSAGRALIWGDGSYRQIVYDRNNNLQWDQTTAISGSSSGGTTIGDGLPVGIVLPASTVIAPVNYQFAYGQALSRAAYADLYSAITITTSITCTGGSPTISNVSDTTNLSVGTVLEALCVSGSPTIISKTSNTVTLSGNATISTNTTGIFYIYGNGDGLTTFNVPDYRGAALVGRCNMGGVNCSNLNSTYFSTNVNNTPSALNAVGGSQSHTLTLSEIPTGITSNNNINISVSLPPTQSAATVSNASIASVQVLNSGAGSFWVPYIGGNGWGNQNLSSGTNSITVTSINTGGAAHSIIPPSKTTNYIIKVLPDINIGTALISQLGGGVANKLVGTDSSGIFDNVSLPAGMTLSNYNLKFVANACSANNWFSGISIEGVFTCTQPNFADLAGSIAIGQIPNNLITNAKLAQAGAATIKGNPTGSTANEQDFTIQGLTARGTPDGANDKLPIYDDAAGTIKYVTPNQIASAGVAGVSSLNGLTGDLNGADLNTLNSVTANYTIQTTDCGKTVQAGTGSTGLFTITLPAVAGFSSVCTVNIKNGDTGRGKRLSGFPSDVINSVLWPLQAMTVKIINGAWAITSYPGRWRLPANTELCVRQDGSNTSDGLGNGTVAADCLATIQYCTNTIYRQIDANNYYPKCGIYTGGTSTFAEAVAMQGQLTGYNLLGYSIRGAVTWSSTSACLTISDNAEAAIDAVYGSTLTFTCNTSNTVNTGAIYGHQVMVVDVSGAINWRPGGTNDSFLFMDGEGRGTINGTGAGITLGNGGVASGYSYVNCNYHCAGVTTGGTLGWTGTLALSAFYVALGGSVISHSSNPSSGTPGAIGASIILGNSVIRLNGLTPPGGAPTTGSGGQSCATTC